MPLTLEELQQDQPQGMTFDEFTKFSSEPPAAPKGLSFDEFTKLEPPPAAEPAKKTYQYKIFGGKYEQPEWIKPDEQGGGIDQTKYNNQNLRPLPLSKDDLYDGGWYKLPIPGSTGDFNVAMWHKGTDSFHTISEAQTQRAPGKSGIPWTAAVTGAWQSGDTEAGRHDVRAMRRELGVHEGPPEPASQNLSPASPDVMSRVATEGTKAQAIEEINATNPLYKNALYRMVFHATTGLLGELKATGQRFAFEPVSEADKAAEETNKFSAELAQSQQIAQRDIPGAVSPQAESTLTGAVKAGEMLVGGWPAFLAETAGTSYNSALDKGKEHGMDLPSREGAALLDAGIQTAVMSTIGRFMPVPQKELIADLTQAASKGAWEGIGKLGKNLASGFGMMGATSAAAQVTERLTGLDPTAATKEKLWDAVKDAALNSVIFTGAHAAISGLKATAPEAIDRIANDPTWKNIYDATKQRIGDAQVRQTFQEAAKAVLQENAPEAKPVAPEAQPEPVTKTTEVPNAPQQVDVVRPDNLGAPQGSEVSQDQGQVRGQEGQRPGGGDSVQGQGQEVNQAPETASTRPLTTDERTFLDDANARLDEARGKATSVKDAQAAQSQWRAELDSKNIVDTLAGYRVDKRTARPPSLGEQPPVVEGGGQAQVAPAAKRPTEGDWITRADGKPVQVVGEKNGRLQVNIKAAEGNKFVVSMRTGEEFKSVTPPEFQVGQPVRTQYPGADREGIIAAQNPDGSYRVQHPGTGRETASNSPFQLTPTEEAGPGRERPVDTQAAWDAAKASAKKFADISKGKLYANPFDPELIKAAADMTLAYVKAGGKSFRDFVRRLTSELGHDFVVTSGDYLKNSWNNLRAQFPHLDEAVHPNDLEPKPLSETTAAKNAAVDEDRQILDRMEISTGEKQSWAAAREKAIQQGIPEKALSIAAEVVNTKRGLTTEEAAGIVERKNALKNEHNFLAERIAKLTDMGDIKETAAELARVGNEFDILDEAIKKGGTPIAQALNIRKMTIDRDFNILSVKARAKAAKGEALSPKEDLELTGATQRLKKVVDQQEEAQQKLKNIQEDKKTAATKDVQKQVEDLQKKVDEAPLPEDLNKLAQKLARHFVEQGIDGREPLIDAVHNELKQVLPDISRRQVMDAISGYGDFKQLSTDEVSVKLRDLKGQMQQLAKLEDMAKGIAPSKTGIERRTPSDTERGLIKQVGEAKKKGGYEVTDPEKQLKTALDAIKTRLKNQITDLTSQIESRTKIVKEKTATPRDEEANRLTAERDRLKEQFDSIFGKPELTDEQRIQMAKRAVEKNIKDYERRLKEGDFSPRNAPSKTPNTPELEALRAQREQLAAKYKEANPNPPELQRAKDKLAQLQEHLAQGTLPEPAVRGKPNPKTEKIQAQIDDLRQQLRNSEPAQKQRLEKTIARLEARLKEFTWWNQPKAKEPKEDKPLMTELESLDYKANLLRQQIQAKIAKLKPRTTGQKISDMAIWWRRLGVLSSPVSLVKLGSAAAEGMTFEPVKEAVGAGILKMFPSLAARTRAESASSLRIEANALAKAFTQLATDIGRNIKSGTTDYELKYGGKEPLPEEMVNFFARLHGATKSPLKRQTFERSFAKIAQQYGKAGANLDDPMVQMQIGTHAYAEANRALFMESNVVTDFINRGLQSTTEPSKDTGEPTKSGLALRTTVKLALPIMRIPTNLVSRTFQAALGLPVGAARLTAAFARGIDTLPPAQADSIMRQLKAGSIGAAFLLYGYYNRANIGGYYQPGQKRDEQDVKADQTRLFGVDFPAWTQHHPFFMVMQLGATIGRVAESYRKKADTEPRGIRQGIEGGIMGAAEQAPIVRETFDLGKLQDPNQRDKWLQDFGESLIVPLGVQWLYKKIVPKDTSADDAKALKQMERDLKTMSQNLDLSKENSRKRLEAAQKRMSK